MVHAVRIAEEVQTIRERATTLLYTYFAYLVICEGMLKDYSNNLRTKNSLKSSIHNKYSVFNFTIGTSTCYE
jgi:hypothetical protein